MLKDFEKHILDKKLFNKQDRLLLAVSGGVDSVVLAHLLKTLNYQVILAHCNFQLRGAESVADENFCIAIAKQYKFEIVVKHFDTALYAKKNHLSIQMAARELRYTWFEELRKKKKTKYLLTAHHADDSAETILLNLTRGTGLKGLSGIQSRHQHLIRPLLIFSKEEILQFAKKNKLQFREDSSNSEQKYKRNFIRLQILPRLKKINPSITSTLLQSANFIEEDLELLNEYIEIKSKALVKVNKQESVISISELLNENHVLAISKHLLFPYGFNADQVNSLITNLKRKGLSGKEFKSPTHQLHIARHQLIIQKNTSLKNTHFVFENYASLKNYSGFKIEENTRFEKTLAKELLIEKEKLIYPLVLRNKKNGDRFKPFGMKGFKLLSDFFKEQALNTIQKNKVPILVNGNQEIIWVLGYRSDDRYRVNEKSNNFIKITSLES